MLVIRESADGYFTQITADSSYGKVHLRQLHCCACGFLTVNGDLFRVSVMTLHELHRLHKHTAGTAARIINRTFERLDHLCNQIDNAFWSIELSLALAFLHKPITIKIECYRIVTRMLTRGHRTFCRCQCFEFTKEEPELVYEYQTDEEQDFSRADEIAASLNLTENMSLALDYRMSGLSYPEIAKQLSRAVSTVYEYFEKMRARYSAIYG